MVADVGLAQTDTPPEFRLLRENIAQPRYNSFSGVQSQG